MPPENEKPRLGTNRGSVKALFGEGSKSPQPPAVKSNHYESRRNAAACFKSKKAGEPHYTGVMVIDDLPTGTKCWVNVGVREITKGKNAGQKYFSVSIRRVEALGHGDKC